jgi:hypothetical protein
MTDAPEKLTDESVSLYISDAELHRRVSARMGRDRFRARILEAENRGFPRIHPFWGGRYWPDVVEWLANQQKANTNGSVADADDDDGPENFDATPQRPTRHQAGAPPAAVLDRRPVGVGSHGFPRQVHPARSKRG